MIRITDALTVEHAMLRSVFSHLDNILPGLERLQDIKALAQMVGGLLHQHGQVEENMLYVPLDHALAETNQLEHMSQEHEELDERLAKACAATDVEEARRNLQAAMAFSRHHFENEERKVFPFIHQRLSDDILKAIGEARYLRQATSSTA
jgi:hemerythrin-like domain-containing protein